MTFLKPSAVTSMLLCLANCLSSPALAATSAPVTTPPESFFEIVDERHRDAAREFYKKYVEVDGLPVVAAEEVADEALMRTCDIVSHMLAGRPDVVEEMNKTELLPAGSR